MSVDLTSKPVKCKKRHRCEWCGEMVDVCEMAHYRSGIYEGDFFSAYFHPECWDALGKGLDGEDEFMPFDQLRGKSFAESHA